MRFHLHSLLFSYVEMQSEETVTRIIRVNIHGTLKGDFRFVKFKCFLCGRIFVETELINHYWVE